MRGEWRGSGDPERPDETREASAAYIKEADITIARPGKGEFRALLPILEFRALLISRKRITRLLAQARRSKIMI